MRKVRLRRSDAFSGFSQINAPGSRSNIRVIVSALKFQSSPSSLGE
jgi:hypothetical protein